LSLFRLAEDGSEDAGKLVVTFHLSDVISIRTRAGPGTAGRKSELQIGDSGGQTLVLRAENEENARVWANKVMAAKNELLDAVRQLDLESTEPSVLMVTASDAATLGPYECVISLNIGFRSPFRLPFLTKESVVTVQLTHGTIRLNGADLCAQAAAASRRSPDADDADDEGSYWVRALRPPGGVTGSNHRPLQVCVQVSAPQEDTVPVGVLYAASFWGWMWGAPLVDGNAKLPGLATLLGRLAMTGAEANTVPGVLGGLGAALLSLGVLRARSSGVVPALEGVLAAGLGTLVLALAVVTLAKRRETHQPAHRLKLTLVAFSWDTEAGTMSERSSGTQRDSPISALCPDRFVGMVRGDVENALQWWQKTKAWRASVKPERLLQPGVPRNSYHDIKGVIEHYYHKRDRMGRLVYIEVLNSPRLAFQSLREKGWGVEDVVEHMMFLNEYAFRELLEDYDEEGVQPKPTGQLIKIMDIQVSKVWRQLDELSDLYFYHPPPPAIGTWAVFYSRILGSGTLVAT
jgi:hypothetical protein